jgi:DedD protein
MAELDTEATPDGQLELKKRARRRLVGAAALALLAAIILPMVMDHEPRQPAQDVQVRIPAQDTGGVAAKILPNKATSTPLPPAPPDSAPDVKAGAKPEAAPETKTLIDPKPAAEIPRDDKPVEKAVEKAAEKPAEKPAANKADEARARAALLGKEIDEPWLVLIGAYKDEANVKQLTGKLKQLGLPVITERFDSPQGPRTRVRAGPFKSKDAAEQAAAKMKKIGISGQVKQSAK